MWENNENFVEKSDRARNFGYQNDSTSEAIKQTDKTQEDPQTNSSATKMKKPEIRHVWEGIYEDPSIVKLAEQCKNGDVVAMKGMSAFFRSRCKPSLAELLDQYEANPNGENEQAVQKYLNRNFHEMNIAKAYMMWMVRAALYGDEAAANQIERWPFYKWYAFIPYKMMIGKDRSWMNIWASNFLYQVGLIDFPSHYEDCGIEYDPQRKCYIFSYVSNYIPPDEEGFGAEWEYTDIYFDEFFRRLPGKPEYPQET